MRIRLISFSLLLFIVLQNRVAVAQEVGLQLYSLRHSFEKDVPGSLAKVKAMGFKEVELGETYGLPFHDFMKLLAENGLEVKSYGTSFEKISKFPQTVADEARAFGAKFVVVFWIPHDSVFTASDVDRAAEVFNQAGKIIAHNGLLLCYHPHGYEFRPHTNGTVFDYMVDKFDPRFVQFEMDVFWVKQGGQDPAALLRKYANRFILLHLKDRRKGTASSFDGHAPDETNVVLGQGDVGIAEIMKLAREIGIKHYFIEDESPAAEEQIPKSLEYLRNLQLK